MHSHRCWFKYYLNIYSWFLIKNLLNDTWEAQKGFSSCDAHIPHIDGGFKISCACQSIPATYHHQCQIVHANIETCNYFVDTHEWRYAKCSPRNSTSFFCPDFLKLNSQSVNTFHPQPTPRFQLRQTQDMAVVDWSSVGHSQTSCGQAVFVVSSSL